MSMGQAFPNGCLETITKFWSEGMAWFHDQKEKDLLILVLWPSSAYADDVAEVLQERCLLNNVIDLAATETDTGRVCLHC